MGINTSKNGILGRLKEARYHNVLKRDIIDFLSKINNESLYDNRDIIITQAEVLLVRSSNYLLDADDNKTIPFLESQVPPAYEQENDERNLSDAQFRDYIKRVCFYFQYFLECK